MNGPIAFAKPKRAVSRGAAQMVRACYKPAGSKRAYKVMAVVRKNKYGQFLLPEHTISAGFASRVWDIEWILLDALPPSMQTKFIKRARAVY